MLQIFVMMIFGKVQESIGPAWGWALLFAAVSAALFGFHPVVFSITAVYAWGYFLLLRRMQDSLPMWFAVYLLGAVLPFILPALSGD